MREWWTSDGDEMTNECGQEAEQRSGYEDKQVENRSGVRELGSFNNCTSKRLLDVLKPGALNSEL